MKRAELCFEMECIGMNCDEINFLRELYYLMKKYNVHRLYSVLLEKNKAISALQLINITIGNTKFTKKFFNIMNKYMYFIYLHIFYKNHLYRYNVKLKHLLKKYNIEKIEICSFSLYNGIHITLDSIYARDVDLVYTDKSIFHIKNLHLNF